VPTINHGIPPGIGTLTISLWMVVSPEAANACTSKTPEFPLVWVAFELAIARLLPHPSQYAGAKAQLLTRS
jgi:hypothetical protein